ncbi:MAG: nucleoside-specific outer membrane channel protein Tsx [Gammaproteobacteria bacterium]|jgi:nucleoside-specific outer membrane channel protein Tsx
MLVLLIFSSELIQAEGIFNWTSTNIQFLTGDGFELGSSNHNTITFEHADGWKYGENFLFVDFIQRDDVGLAVYGEFYPRLSLNKLTDNNMSFGLFKDFSIVGGINAGSEPSSDPFMAYLFGGGISFDIPHTEYIKLDIMAYKNDDVNSLGVQITPVWSVPFSIGGLDFKFRGFLDWLSAGATGGEDSILTQPQLLLDVGNLIGHKNQFYAGIEYWYWHNKFGIKGVTEQSAQATLMYTF